MQMIEFTWWRCLDGYRLKQSQPCLLTARGRVPIEKANLGLARFAKLRPSWGIATASDRFEQTTPLEVPALFARFARDTPTTPEGILSFCNKYGLLTEHSPHRKPGQSEVSVDSILSEQKKMRKALDLYEDKDDTTLASFWNSIERENSLRIELRASREERFRMILAPPNLLMAMWMQFALSACSQSKLFRCQRCNQPFTVGTGTGRRSTSKYCSNACKVAAFKERREYRVSGNRSKGAKVK
jgi:hypothetical protein